MLPGSFSLSIPKNFKVYQDHLRHVAATLSTQTGFLLENTQKLVEILQPSVPGRVALTVNGALLEPVRAIWSTLPSVLPVAKCMEKHYFVFMQGFEGFYSHPAPNSLVLMAVNDKAQQGRFKSIPKYRHSKWFDLLGGRSTSSSLQMRITNQQALLSKYAFLNWSAVSKFVDQLLEALLLWTF